MMKFDTPTLGLIALVVWIVVTFLVIAFSKVTPHE